MKLLNRLKNLFVPREEKGPRRKITKKIKKKTSKNKKKPTKKIKKVKVKTRKKKIKVRKKVVKKIKRKVKKKVLNKKTGPKVKKKTPKKRSLKKKLLKPLKKTLEEKEIGVITHYFGKISVGIIKLKSRLKTGERIHIKGAHDDFTQTIKSMQINHKDVSMAGKGSEIGIKVSKPVHENDRVYKV